jgi:ADP-ribosylglycohydrolase
LRRDFGEVRDFEAPRPVHPDSILWRSSYEALNEKGDILHDQAPYWGRRGVHYHQFLKAGENTLNLQLARVLLASLEEKGRYDGDDYLARYIAFMRTPGTHRDTYLEEYHRHFFTQYARGRAPRKCGGSDIHIGGLAHVGVLCARLEADAARLAVREHVGLTHGSGEVLAAAEALCQMLCAVIAGADLRASILQYGSDWFSARKASQWSAEPDSVVVGRRVSSACYIADAFPASLYLAWKYAGDFEAALIANTNLGGDNCHRGAVIGALVGAAVGVEKIPARFIAGLVQ